MEFTSGNFHCLAAVNCPTISRQANSSVFVSKMKHRNVCEAFYNSQKSIIVHGRHVVTDLSSSYQYAKFVNSECSKSAIPDFLAYFGFVLFAQAFLLLVLDNMWLKLPTTSSVIDNFTTLVMACYAAPCPNFELTQALLDMPESKKNYENQGINQFYEVSILDDTASVNLLKSLYEKVKVLEEIIKCSQKFIKIWQLYLIQSVAQALCAFIFLIINVRYMTDLKDTMTCTITQYIPVEHDYFICSHSLAPTFVKGLKYVYLPMLAITFTSYIVISVWTLLKVTKNWCEYDFEMKGLPKLVGSVLVNIDPVNGDLGFLLHLLHSYDKVYVARFAHFMSKLNEKKTQAFVLSKRFPVSKLRNQLEENGKKLIFNKVPGIPQTIFELTTEIVELELIQCGPLENEDFDKFNQLTSLRRLTVSKCDLKCIPDGILKMPWLESLNLQGNCISTIDHDVSSLESLTSLNLSENDLRIVKPESLDRLCNLFDINLSGGNTGLGTPSLQVILACKRLDILQLPEHLFDREPELNESEKKKFKRVIKLPAKDGFVIPCTPEDARHSDLANAL